MCDVCKSHITCAPEAELVGDDPWSPPAAEIPRWAANLDAKQNRIAATKELIAYSKSI